MAGRTTQQASRRTAAEAPGSLSSDRTPDLRHPEDSAAVCPGKSELPELVRHPVGQALV